MKRFGIFWIFAVIVNLFFICGGITSAKAENRVRSSCDAEIDWQLASGVEVKAFDCEIGKFKGRSALIIKIALKNTASEPQRFRVLVFLADKHQGAGTLLPRRGTPPVLNPGTVQSVKIPFLHNRRRSKRIRVQVERIAVQSPLASTGQSDLLSIGSAGIGGIYYPYGFGLAQIWNKTVSGVRAAVISTNGSAENIGFCNRGDMEFGAAASDVAYPAYRGSGSGLPPAHNIRAMFAMYPSILHVIARRHKGIYAMDDLRGKRVSIGAPQSGTARMSRRILQGLGIQPSEFRALQLPFNETIRGLKSGKIDVGILNVAPPTALIINLLATHDMGLIGFSGEQLKQINGRYPFYVEHTLPAGFYPNQDTELSLPAVWNLFICRADISEKRIYALTRAVFDNPDLLMRASPFAKYTTPANTIRYSGLPLHPGVVKRFQETGIEIPPYLIP